MIAFMQGDVVEVLSGLPAECFDSCVSDFPYGLSAEPDVAEVMRHWLAAELREHAEDVLRDEGIEDPRRVAWNMFAEEAYVHRGGGFMGKQWDSFVPGPEVWRAIYRVLKPGAYAAVFGGTRTYDLLVLGARIAGFEIRDQLDWLYGSGFPKSLDVSKAITVPTKPGNRHEQAGPIALGASGMTDISEPVTPDAARWAGYGTALKPAHEPIVLVRKPLRGTVARNVLAFGTGALNIDGCRIGDEPRTNGPPGDPPLGPEVYALGMRGKGKPRDCVGRWPANVLFDAEAYPPEAVDKDGNRYFYQAKAAAKEREAGLAEAGAPLRSGGQLTDREDASAGLRSPRAGAGRGGGRRNPHPTIKPIELVRWLARLVTPAGGTVCVPFSGVGSEVIACGLEGLHAVGVELAPEYVAIARARAGHWLGRPDLTAEAAVWWRARGEAASAAVGWLLGAAGDEITAWARRAA